VQLFVTPTTRYFLKRDILRVACVLSQEAQTGDLCSKCELTWSIDQKALCDQQCLPVQKEQRQPLRSKQHRTGQVALDQSYPQPTYNNFSYTRKHKRLQLLLLYLKWCWGPGLVLWIYGKKSIYGAIPQSNGEKLHCKLPATQCCLNTENTSTAELWWLKPPTNEFGPR
jgi:hypothetical protein